MNTPQNRRVLIVDDMVSIHEDFRKILAGSEATADLSEDEAVLFGAKAGMTSVRFELESAYQGAEAAEKVRASVLAGRPYSMAFVDMRMPPGWDGVETIEHLWQEDPELQVVICTAYTDYSWTEVLARLELLDRLLILKKPFEAIEVYQLAIAMTEKWRLAKQAAFKMNALEQAVEIRTRDLSDANIIVRNSPIILYRLRGEPSFPLIYISHSITNLGYEPAALLASSDWARTLIAPDDQPRFFAAMARTLEKESAGASIELRLRTAEGFFRWVENRYIPVRDKLGRLVEIEGIVIDITERKAAEEKIVLLARMDGLTGLANRTTFIERLRYACAAADRGAPAFAILYLDLDHFKPVNDMFGHSAGDLLLQEVAERLRRCTRESDLVARLGGDEFAVIQGELAEHAHAGVLAEKIQKSLAIPFSLNGNEARISVSIGICPYLRGGGGPDQMLAHADLALYRSKKSGRDQFHFHTEDLDQEVLTRVTLANDLRNAIERGELELQYQPQVELGSGSIVGMEALVRWNHPTRGVLAPGIFIPIAEKSGTIVALGRWVLEQACRQMRMWRDEGLVVPVIAINLSLVELNAGDDLVREVSRMIAKWRLASSDIEFDVTEATLAQLASAQSGVLAQLHQLGVNIAIDDFGSEYSSFEYIRAYRVKHLKIAQSFIRKSTLDAESVATTHAIVNFAKAVGIGIIAQGVETEEQRALLAATDFSTRAQGFHFSEAVGAARAGELLRQGHVVPDSRESEVSAGTTRGAAPPAVLDSSQIPRRATAPPGK